MPVAPNAAPTARQAGEGATFALGNEEDSNTGGTIRGGIRPSPALHGLWWFGEAASRESGGRPAACPACSGLDLCGPATAQGDKCAPSYTGERAQRAIRWLGQG